MHTIYIDTLLHDLFFVSHPIFIQSPRMHIPQFMAFLGLCLPQVPQPEPLLAAPRLFDLLQAPLWKVSPLNHGLDQKQELTSFIQNITRNNQNGHRNNSRRIFPRSRFIIRRQFPRRPSIGSCSCSGRNIRHYFRVHCSERYFVGSL